MAPIQMRLILALAGMALSTVVVSAQESVPAPAVPMAAPKASSAAAQRGGRDIRSVIKGVAMDSNKKPLARASLRLRNLTVNTVEQVGTSNARGEFSFVARLEIPYVVELVNPEGYVLTVGDIVQATSGEVTGVVVMLPAQAPKVAGIFGDTATSVILAAAGMGLTVVDPALPKVSPTQ